MQHIASEHCPSTSCPVCLWRALKAWCWKSSKGQLCQGSCVSENKSHLNLPAFPMLSSLVDTLYRRSFTSNSGKSFTLKKPPAWVKLWSLLPIFYFFSSSAGTSLALPTMLLLRTRAENQGDKSSISWASFHPKCCSQGSAKGAVQAAVHTSVCALNFSLAELGSLPLISFSFPQSQ